MDKQDFGKEYYSSCCGAFMPRWPDIDLCPKCKEHASGFTEDEMEAEGNKTTGGGNCG